MNNQLDTIWNRIVKHEGEVFTLKRGKQFTYTITSENSLKLNTTNRGFSKGEIQKALSYFPPINPGQLTKANLQAPSYIFSLLTDDRIIHGLS